MGIRSCHCIAAVIGSLLLSSAAGRLVARDDAVMPTGYDLERVDADLLEEAARTGEVFYLPCGSSVLPLLLEPSPIRSARFRVLSGDLDHERLSFASPPRTFQGTVLGEPESVVRVSTGHSGVRACIKRAQGWTFVEPIALPGGIAGEHMVYSDTDVDLSFAGVCAAEAGPLGNGPADDFEPHVDSLAPPLAEAGELRVLEIAVDADVDYYNVFGEDTQAEIESVLNVVDGIFQAELGLRLELVMVRIWDAEPDPYEVTSSSGMLQEVRNYWNASHRDVVRDVTHLFTGKDLDGSTVGIAYVGVVCSQTVSYSLSQNLSSQVLMPLLVAHEIGHNLGANHDDSSAEPRYIMYPSLGISNLDEFSDLSQAAIASFTDGVSCLALEGADGGGTGAGAGGGGGDSGGGGGGGGGPVDPFSALLVAAAFLLQRSRRPRTNGAES